MRHVGNDSDAFVFIRVTWREQSVIPVACDPPDQIDRREEANVGKPSEKDLCQFVLAELQLSQASEVDKGRPDLESGPVKVWTQRRSARARGRSPLLVPNDERSQVSSLTTDPPSPRIAVTTS